MKAFLFSERRGAPCPQHSWEGITVSDPIPNALRAPHICDPGPTGDPLCPSSHQGWGGTCLVSGPHGDALRGPPAPTLSPALLPAPALSRQHWF